MKAKSLVYAAVMAALITVCAWITIPTVVPFTLQTFAIFLAVGVLGGKLGSLAVGVYLLMGAVGLPVFSGFSGGLGSFAGVTGGYLTGFLLIALVMWAGEALLGHGPVVFVLSGIVGLAVCYGFGTAWFVLMYAATTGPMGVMSALWTCVMSALWTCVIPFLLPDAVKLVLALALSRRLAPALARA